MRVRLGGWHRLWLVASGVYLVVVIAFVSVQWPQAVMSRTELAAWIHSKVKTDEPDPELVDRYLKSHPDVKVAEEDPSSVKENLLKDAFLWWVIPCVGLYLFGFCVAWVYRGFKQKSENQ
jgi:hypothetical protein